MPKPKLHNLSVGSFNIGDGVAECQLDASGLPIIVSEGQVHSNLLSLTKAFPDLVTEGYLKPFITAANFLFQGIKFHPIDSISKFQKEYVDRIEYEQDPSKQFLKRISDYGIFDVSQMHSPKVIGDKLIFFVREDYTDLPYRVTCDFPITTENPEVKYELLPYI